MCNLQPSQVILYSQCYTKRMTGGAPTTNFDVTMTKILKDALDHHDISCKQLCRLCFKQSASRWNKLVLLLTCIVSDVQLYLFIMHWNSLGVFSWCGRETGNKSAHCRPHPISIFGTPAVAKWMENHPSWFSAMFHVWNIIYKTYLSTCWEPSIITCYETSQRWGRLNYAWPWSDCIS